MNIEQLRAMGLVHSNPLVRKEFKVRYFPLKPPETWATPGVEEREPESVEGEVVVYLRKMTAADQLAVRSAVKGDQDFLSVLIHRSVFDENGARVFPTVEDAAGINVEMFAGLVEELTRMNPVPKRSRAKMSSGANSPSPLAGGPSPNGRTPSAPMN